jgi:hypothetical protein
VRAGGATKEELLARLERARVELNQSARELFTDERFTTSATRYVLETVEYSVAELGLPRGGTSSNVLERARTKGLSVCPLEVGPHLRLQFTDPSRIRAADQPARTV